MDLRRSSNQGFTIIETLIVLAIAGLIILLMFQAIPALTRNSRNTQRKQDVAHILQAVSSYMLRNSANFPDESNKTELLSRANLTHYQTASIFIPVVDDNPLTVGPISDNTDQVNLYKNRKCRNPDDGKGINTGADYRDVVALYSLESSNGIISKCQQL